MYALGQSLLGRLELLAQAYVRLLQECRVSCHLNAAYLPAALGLISSLLQPVVRQGHMQQQAYT